ARRRARPRRRLPRRSPRPGPRARLTRAASEGASRPSRRQPEEARKRGENGRSRGGEEAVSPVRWGSFRAAGCARGLLSSEAGARRASAEGEAMRASLRFFGAAGLVVLACAPVQAGTLATSALFSGNGDDLVCMLSNVGTTPLANVVVAVKGATGGTPAATLSS